MFSPLLLTSVTMTLSLAPQFEPVRCSTSRPLPFRIAIQTLFLFLISYAVWLIPTPPLSLSGSCKHTTSVLQSTAFASAAMVHSYNLAHLCWITLISGSLGSLFSLIFIFSHGCGCKLGHHSIFHLSWCLLILRVRKLRFACRPVFPSPRRPMSKHHYACPWCHLSSCVCGRPPCKPYSPPLLHCLGGFSHLRQSVAKPNVIASAVGALLQCMTAEWSLLCCAPHHVALVVACLVMTWSVATCRLAAAQVLDVTPSTGVLTSAVRTHVCVWFDSVPHSHCLDALLHQALCHIATCYNKSNQWCGDFSILPNVLDGVGLHQLPYLGGDFYAFVLCFVELIGSTDITTPRTMM